MILYLPERFDTNEWYIIIIWLVVISCIWMLPRRFPPTIGLLYALIPLILAKLFDTILIFPPFEQYYMNDIKGVELFDLLLYFTYPCIGYLSLYAYDRFHPKSVGTVAILILTSLFAVFFEWVSAKAGLYHYTGWKVYYSLPIYFFMQSLYVIMYECIKREYTRTKL
ncbi:hypothetical protein EHS13_15135 [Paenibacillus psychroresistens]|uniref:Transmembrane protein n=1 Tax=Paenibacillus psychroresistens TaxID=1778678 RepID=A0A6B8RKJ0_9BACL|nr:hypothetical protein [Paenibacillus psychroresistens]QGQ96112.1 hypothetical protein EHS13_15135 [Paenibacillus psychroresistens]